MKCRIAYFVNSYPAISHAFIRREIHALERRGLEVVRFSLRGWDNKIVDPLDAAEQAATEYVLRAGPWSLVGDTFRLAMTSPRGFFRALMLAMRMGWRSVRPLPYHFVYLAEACRLVTWLRRSEATHVHAHFGTNSAEVVALAHALGGPPYSFTVHGPLEFDSPQYLGLREKIRGAAFVVAITSYTRSQLYRCSDYADWPKIRLVRCGLQPEIFEEAPQQVSGEARLVCIGRLVEQKGQALLVEAAATLARRNIDFRLVLVGGGPLHDELARLVEANGLQERVELLGAVSTQRLYDELRRARALVLPSFAEGLPMVIMEAMALRRPVISTYIAGIPELVRDGEDGRLVPAGSVAALVDAMADMLSRPVAELRAMGGAAFERVKALHHSDTEVAKLAELFQQSAAGEDLSRAPLQ
jgi:colanic acid/amylovoran biosynthesis glycosyltransferase